MDLRYGTRRTGTTDVLLVTIPGYDRAGIDKWQRVPGPSYEVFQSLHNFLECRLYRNQISLPQPLRCKYQILWKQNHIVENADDIRGRFTVGSVIIAIDWWFWSSWSSLGLTEICCRWPFRGTSDRWLHEWQCGTVPLKRPEFQCLPIIVHGRRAAIMDRDLSWAHLRRHKDLIVFHTFHMESVYFSMVWLYWHSYSRTHTYCCLRNRS